jgi:hypothetical protein
LFTPPLGTVKFQAQLGLGSPFLLVILSEVSRTANAAKDLLFKLLSHMVATLWSYRQLP